MTWIETADGELVNLDQTSHIAVDEMTNRAELWRVVAHTASGPVSLAMSDEQDCRQLLHHILRYLYTLGDGCPTMIHCRDWQNP